jgi:type VI secretion system protein ImpA
MSAIDVEQLLAAISDESPCGDDLEYDPAFGELERAAQGKPEQQMGDEVVPAEEADWRDVRDKAIELLGRSKDLRVALQLTTALAHTDGLPGFSDGLAVMSGLLDRYWGGFHPKLDPDDDLDPTMRVNILASLCDQGAVLGLVRTTPLVSSRALGRFGLREIEMADGKADVPEGVEAPSTAAIDGAFLDCDIEDLQATADAVNRAVEHTDAIDSTLTEQVGYSNTCDFSPLKAVLAAAQSVLNAQLARRGVGVVVEEGAAAVEGAPGAAQPLAGEISSREDVIRVLDKACDYFERHEPSSPVPLLLKRAKRLISKSFLDIMRDLAPDGVPQAETIGGVASEEPSESEY